MLRKERESRWRHYVGALFFVLFGIGIGIWHNRMGAQGQSDGLTSLVRTVTVPLVSGLSNAGQWFSRQVGWLFRGRALEEENRRLREEAAWLREENARLREAEITAQRLRKQLGFAATPPADRIAADVIARRPNPHFETLVISRGSRDGVRLQSVVVAPQGLVGHVYDVAPTSAAVLLLTDSNSAVGAMVQRADSRATGICKGNGTERLSMTYLDHAASVKVGDRIISSGLGGEKGVFPKGLVIGTVTEIANDATGAARHVFVQPAVDFDRLEEVYVLR